SGTQYFSLDSTKAWFPSPMPRIRQASTKNVACFTWVLPAPACICSFHGRLPEPPAGELTATHQGSLTALNRYAKPAAGNQLRTANVNRKSLQQSARRAGPS